VAEVRRARGHCLVAELLWLYELHRLRTTLRMMEGVEHAATTTLPAFMLFEYEGKAVKFKERLNRLANWFEVAALFNTPAQPHAAEAFLSSMQHMAKKRGESASNTGRRRRTRR
jgi:hypothetical protein